MSRQEDITELLHEWSDGDLAALPELMPLVIDELRLLAQSHFRRESSGHTLQPTALINEVYMRLVRQTRVKLHNRTEFFAFASRLMRRVLVDHHRARQASKRGNGLTVLSLDEEIGIGVAPPASSLAKSETVQVDLLALDTALEGLKALDPRQCRVVELRFFGGLTVPETAQVLGISPATVKREWSTAKAWLQHELRSA